MNRPGMNHKLILAGLLLLTLSLRLWAAYSLRLMAKDGIKYLRMAHYFHQGEFSRGLAIDYHPLYPLLIAPVYNWFPEPEQAGQLISLIFGTLTLWPLYWLGLRLFSPTIALIVGLLFACHPYLIRVSADVLSEATYMFFFTAAVALGWQALLSNRHRYYFLAAASGSMAYLSRPEGILAVLILLAWTLLPTKDRQLRSRIKTAVAIILAVVLLAFPYMLYLRQETGHWTLTKKKSIKTLLGIHHDYPNQGIGRQ